MKAINSRSRAKILFILPYYKELSGLVRMKRWALKTFSFYPLSIPILAALTPSDRFTMDFVNEYWDEPVDFSADADIVALSFVTASARRAYEIGDAFRRRGKLVVMGGIHVSYCPEEALKHADVVIVGEAEETWPQFLRDYEANRVQTVYRAPREVPPELIPIPDRRITRRPWKLSNLSLMATRGCPYACDFCNVSSYFGRKVRCRPVDKVLEDITGAFAQGGYHTRTIVFKDDNIIINRDYARSLLERMIPLKVRWVGQANIRSIDDPETLKLMGKSGCVLLTVGLESVKAKYINQFGKSYVEPGRVKEVISGLHKHNILVLGSYMFGFDDDTSETIEEILEQAYYFDLDIVTFYVRTPFPGTALYEKLEREGRLLEKRWECYDVEHFVFEPQLVSSQELNWSRYEAIRRFYSTPAIIKRMAKAGMRIVRSGRRIPLSSLLYLNLTARAVLKAPG